MKFNKKSAQDIFKTIFQNFFKLVHGNIEGVIKLNENKEIEIFPIKKNENKLYNVFKVKNGRLYTDRINDTAIIYKKKIIDGPSFQFRDLKSKVINGPVESNIVFKKGTPRLKKNIKGKILSLLTGGGGNDNYWHWLFDVLPRLGICEEIIDLDKINYFLLPNNKRKFQFETLKILGVSEEKQLSSVNYRHVSCDELYVTDHPVVLTGDATKDITNIPQWISDWLKKSFIKFDKQKVYRKIYIDRGDSISNIKHLRSISNEQEVKKFLLNKGFEIIKLGDLNFKEQVEIFNSAEIIIGLHGAGFANIVFAQKNTKIIEFKSKTAGKVIENLANSNNLIYKSIECEPSNFNLDNQYGHISIPIVNLEKVLK